MTLFENMSPLRFLNAKNDDESVNDFIKTLGTKTKWQVFFRLPIILEVQSMTKWISLFFIYSVS